jgi:hypothetical protein
MGARVDHLVVAAASLDEGAAWCEASLGVAPGPGGEHPLMGTHNRLLRIDTAAYPHAYLEIIAVQPGRSPERPHRWFDLDDETVRDALARSGPRLLHFVAAVADLRHCLAALRALGIERGEAVAASRMTPGGLLEWQISIRGDGQRLFGGTLPTLIEWGAVHPAARMPASGLTLLSLSARHPEADRLQSAYAAIDLEGVSLHAGAPQLSAVLDTPRGRVQVDSGGL